MLNNNKKSTYAPIILFAYKRVDHLKKTVTHLKMNELSLESELIVFSDGYKNEFDKEDVLAVRKYLKSINGFKRVCIIEREKNYGLCYNIITALNSVFKKYENAIIVEDDIVTGKYFLKYMNLALERYVDREKVMAISGYIPNINRTGLDSFFFIPWFECWGWATWKNRWEKYCRNPRRMVVETEFKFIKKINIDGTSPDMWNQVIDNFRGKIKTWAIFFDYMILREKGIVLCPRNSICQNIGLDGSGENCDVTNVYDVSINNCLLSVDMLPENCKIDNLATKRYVEFYKNRFKHNIKRKLKLNVKILIFYIAFHLPTMLFKIHE